LADQVRGLPVLGWGGGSGVAQSARPLLTSGWGRSDGV